VIVSKDIVVIVLATPVILFVVFNERIRNKTAMKVAFWSYALTVVACLGIYRLIGGG
jgi:hypothetical protein